MVGNIIVYLTRHQSRAFDRGFIFNPTLTSGQPVVPAFMRVQSGPSSWLAYKVDKG